MQATSCAIGAPLACRLQRAMGSRVGQPAGLAGGLKVLRPRQARRGAMAARAHFADGFSAAADGAPSAFNDLAAHLSTRLFLLGDAAEALASGGGDAAAAAAAAAGDAAAAAGDAAAEVVDKNGGFFGVFSSTFESFLKVLDGGLEKMGVPYSYGFAIILVTVIVKIATYPLTAKQVESTLSMQAMQPRVKELQAKYANDPERLQVETAKLYQGAGVNPLAGCLPSLATIPIFIGLYRALSNVADEGLLTEGFFWIPSLAGPTTVNGGLGWLFSWENGEPALGWAQTAAYLVLPVLLVVSQAISQKVISPPQQNADPSTQQTQAILKFLPLMIGYFSLNVPSGLTLYWFANNIITTAQQLYLRNKFGAGQLAGAGGASVPASAAVIDVEPVEKKPSGKELNARRSARQASPSPAPSSGGGGSDRGEKFRAIRAREAAAKAAQQASAGGAGAAAQPPAKAERGAKFRALKEQEAAAKAAQAGPSSNGAAPAAAQQEPAAAAVAVAEAEVVVSSDSEEEQQQHQAGSSSSSPAASGGKGGKKKGGKKK